MPVHSKISRDQRDKENFDYTVQPQGQHNGIPGGTIASEARSEGLTGRAASSRQRRVTEKEAQRLAEQEAAALRRQAKSSQKKRNTPAQRNPDANSEDDNISEGDYEDDQDNENQGEEPVDDYAFSTHTVPSKPAALKILAQRNNKIPLSQPRKKDQLHRDQTHEHHARHQRRRSWAPASSDFDADGLPPDFDDDTDPRHHSGDDDILEPEYDNPQNHHHAYAAQKRLRSRSRSPADAPAVKAQKTGPNLNSGATSNRPKAGDYDDITQEILATAISIFRCKISTQAPFPDRLTELQFVQEAWKEGYERNGLPPTEITPTLAKLIMGRVSHVRGELKTKIRPLVEIIYGFGSGQGKKTIARNRKRVEDLKDQCNFVYKVTDPDPKLRKGLYQNKIIQKTINTMWFSNHKDEGVTYREYFDPFPAVGIALVLTAIECGIDEWATGIRTDIAFTAADYHSVYEAHIKSLEDFDHHTHSHRLLHSLSIKLHDAGRVHAGASTIGTASTPALSVEAFNAAIREFEDATTEDSDDDE